MKHWQVIAVFALSACSSAVPVPPRATASVIPNSNTLQVVIHDPKPVIGVRMITAAGETVNALRMDTTRLVGPPSSGASLGFGIGGFSSGRGGGFGSGFGVGVPVGGGTPRVDSVVTATLPINDPDDYRRDWRGYRIDVLFGNPPETLTVNAPPPPP
jgi:hypothetical protein